VEVCFTGGGTILKLTNISLLHIYRKRICFIQFPPFGFLSHTNYTLLGFPIDWLNIPDEGYSGDALYVLNPINIYRFIRLIIQKLITIYYLPWFTNINFYQNKIMTFFLLFLAVVILNYILCFCNLALLLSF
jgi:hypothetical protein